MIDARRWVLAETWLRLGLRVEWASSWHRGQIANDQWMRQDMGDMPNLPRIAYFGDRVWVAMAQANNHYARSRTQEWSAPRMDAYSMQHELAHYLFASEEQRHEINFGIPAGGPDPAGLAVVERSIEAMLDATAHIAFMALTTPGRTR